MVAEPTRLRSAPVRTASKMIPAGYMAKRVLARPDWLPAECVSSIYSVKVRLGQLCGLHDLLEAQRLLVVRLTSVEHRHRTGEQHRLGRNDSCSSRTHPGLRAGVKYS